VAKKAGATRDELKETILLTKPPFAVSKELQAV
jgi:alkylhydroperoxidase/carboxymuconolactone decarboxylase family protein YurZ